jgi:hypothetical protein
MIVFGETIDGIGAWPSVLTPWGQAATTHAPGLPSMLKSPSRDMPKYTCRPKPGPPLSGSHLGWPPHSQVVAHCQPSMADPNRGLF